MAKPKSHRNKRNTRERSVKPKRHSEDKPTVFNKPIIVRKEFNLELSKSFLIICEGQTEAAFFYGIRDIYGLNASKVEILPKKDQNNGMSIKTLLYEAMKKQKEKAIPYDEVWIVPDNDENNSFVLDDNSINRITEVVPIEISTKLRKKQKVKIDVRKSENGKERTMYFLCLQDYETFLKNDVLSDAEQTYIPSIIANTHQNNELSLLFEDKRTSFFYKNNNKFANKNNKGKIIYNKKYLDLQTLKSIKVAYSSISFEHWILLHFERNKHSFYNSREIIKFFDDKGYFLKNFKKGWYIYKNRELGEIQAFFRQTKQAIRNNLWLMAEMQTETNNKKKYYEVNPYSDVCYLVAKLFNTKLANTNVPLNHNNLENLTISKTSSIVQISFTYRRKKPAIANEITACFYITDIDGKIIGAETRCNHDIVRINNNVIIELTPSAGTYAFLNYSEQLEDKNELIFLL